MVPTRSQILYQNPRYDLLAIIGKRRRNGLRILECGFLQASCRSAIATTWSARASISRAPRAKCSCCSPSECDHRDPGVRGPGWDDQSCSEMARPKRFELLTPRFVVWCSIQLSYGRVFAWHLGLKGPGCVRIGSGRVAKERFSYPLRPRFARSASRDLRGETGAVNLTSVPDCRWRGSEIS
jgi:hypothetical protein